MILRLPKLSLPAKKWSMDDEMQAQLDVMNATRGDPEKRQVYLDAVASYEKLYKAKCENNKWKGALAGVAGQTLFFVMYENQHVIRPGFKWVCQKVGFTK